MDIKIPPSNHSRIIRQTRVQHGLSLQEAADHVGIPLAVYSSLESDDETLGDALFETLNLGQIRSLCRWLRLSIYTLLHEYALLDETPPFWPPAGPMLLSQKIQEKCEKKRWSVEELSEHVGCELQPLIADPTAVTSYSLSSLLCICYELDLNLAEVVAEPSTAS